MITPNVTAFLATIRHSEGTDKAADPYRVCYGFSHTIVSFEDHPSLIGEWAGVRDPKWGLTTAAGAYQINRPTWVECKTALKLIDFSPTSQDEAAVFLIKQKGAVDMLDQGRFADAVHACRGVWASLPGGSSGQPEVDLEKLTDVYTTAGGSFA